MEEDQPVQVVSENFNAPDADIICHSLDHVVFRLHSRNLEIASEGFPPTMFSTKEEVILTEHSSTLELMFQFMYPRTQPDLEKLPFKDLARLAEAVEKYQVYPAMQLCRIMMGKSNLKYALQILEYSVKHNYTALSNSAAPYVTLQSLSNSSEFVSDRVLRAWVRYSNEWDKRKCAALQTNPPRHYDTVCIQWSAYRSTIYKALGSKVGVGNFDAVGNAFDLQPDVVKCCRDAASAWKIEYLRAMGGALPFNSFL